MYPDQHKIVAKHMGLLPDFNEIHEQVKRREHIDEILADPSIQAPAFSCLECQFCYIIQDPDPEDDWNFNDEACYCSLLPKEEDSIKFEKEHPEYATKWYPFYFIAVGMRPSQMSPWFLTPVIDECPLNAPDRFHREPIPKD